MSLSFVTVAAVGAFSLLLAFGDTPSAAPPAGGDKPEGIYDFTVKDTDGKDVALAAYKGDVLLIVNVASK